MGWVWVDVESKELEGCKYTFACPRRLVVMSDLFPDGKEGDKTRGTEPSEKETTEMENTKHTGRANSTMHSINRYVYRASKQHYAQYQPLRIQGEQTALCTVSTVTYTGRANSTMHSINRYVSRASKQHYAQYHPLRIQGEQTIFCTYQRRWHTTPCRYEVVFSKVLLMYAFRRLQTNNTPKRIKIRENIRVTARYHISLQTYL